MSDPKDRLNLRKRLIFFLAAMPILVSDLGAASLPKRLSVRFGPAGIIALGGRYSDSEKLNQVVNIGAGLNLGLRYQISENIFLGLGYGFDWLSVKRDKAPFAFKERNPALNLQMLTLEGIFFLVSGYRMEPYLILGGVICPWQFSQGPLGEGSWPAPARPERSFSKTSLGLDVGLGVETYLFSKFSAFAEVKYIYIFARDPITFGTDDFTEQDFLRLTIGLLYGFGKK